MQNSSGRRHTSAPIAALGNKSPRRLSLHHISARSTPGYRPSPLRNDQKRESSPDELGQDSQASASSDEDNSPLFNHDSSDLWVYQPGQQAQPILSTTASDISPSYGLERLVGKEFDDNGREVYVIERNPPGAPAANEMQQRGGSEAFTETFTVPIEDATEHVSIAELEQFEHHLDKKEKMELARAAVETRKSRVNHVSTSTSLGSSKARGRGRPPKVRSISAEPNKDWEEGLNSDLRPFVVLYRDLSCPSKETEEDESTASDDSSSMISEETGVGDPVVNSVLHTLSSMQSNHVSKRSLDTSFKNKVSSGMLEPLSKKAKQSHSPIPLSPSLVKPSTVAPLQTHSSRHSKHHRKRKFEFHPAGIVYPDPVKKGEKREWQIKSILDDRPARGRSQVPTYFNRDRLPANDDPLQDEYLVDFYEYDGEEEFWILEEDLVLSAQVLLSDYCHMRENQWRHRKLK